ncbi:SET domain-containing protein [Sphingomonas tabacisoli]|uniref:SET domain-containing protein n=1 Tax=Sphingomonas tabacisoli TaxID=2249466 RepID=A0ABW4I3Z0_9SPHN
MMMVETELRPSGIHGIGVFLLEPVPKGGLIWRFDSRIDRVYSEQEMASLPPIAQHYLRIYSTWHEAARLWVLCGDNGRHFNHASTPNTVSDGIAFGTDIAAFDLPEGAELTSDYATICDHSRLHGLDFERNGARRHVARPSLDQSVFREP